MPGLQKPTVARQRRTQRRRNRMSTHPKAPKVALVGPAQLQDTNPDPAVVEVKLVAASASLKVFDDTPALDMYTYNGQFPGPTLRARVGD